jgi:hypothetical protein
MPSLLAGTIACRDATDCNDDTRAWRKGTGMKRGFLFGLASFLIFVVLIGLDNAWRGECGFSINGECLASEAVTSAFAIPLIAVLIWRARKAAPNQSRQHAIGGWLIGFFVIPVGSATLFMLAGITAMIVAATLS